MSEDEQIMQAIALSLGQEVAVDDKAKEEEEAKKREKEEKELKRQKERELMTPVSKAELDEFSDILLAGCLELCVSVNDSVAGICDLISAVGKRNEDEWREKALVQIKEKVFQYKEEFTRFGFKHYRNTTLCYVKLKRFLFYSQSQTIALSAQSIYV